MKKAIHIKEYTRVRHGRAKKGGKVTSHNKNCPGGKIRSKGKGHGLGAKIGELTAYCVKCKKKQKMINPKIVKKPYVDAKGNKKHRTFSVSACQVCETPMWRIMASEKAKSGRAYSNTGVTGTCPQCKNKLVHYDGALGYEALVCRNCGYFSDVHGKEGTWEGYMSNPKTKPKGKHGWEEKPYKSGRTTTPFRRRESMAKIMQGEGTYHRMKEDEALSKFKYKARVLFKTSLDKKTWKDAELQFPTYDSAMKWAMNAKKSEDYKDIIVEEI